MELSGISGDGTLGISILAGTATDTLLNPAPPAGPGPTFIVDNTNDDPFITGTVAGQTVNDNATILPFAGATIGDPDLPAQTLHVTVSLDDSAKGVFTTLNGFADLGGGQYEFSGTPAAATAAIQGLVFDPTDDRVALGFSETTTFLIEVQDPSLRTATDTTTTVLSYALAQAPSVTPATTAEDTQTNSGLVISADPGDGSLVTHFKISSITGGSLFKNDGATAIANGSFITTAEGNAGLRFTPALNANGPAGGTFSFVVQAAVDNTGLGLSAGATATITVTEVNDPPVASGETLPRIADGSGDYTIPFSALLMNDSDGPANESGQTLTIISVASPVNGTVQILGTDVIFSPGPGFDGTASFSYTVQDDGTTGGTSDPKTHSATAQIFDVIADSVAEFSGVQGQNGWIHGYRNYTADGGGENYDPTTDFIAFAGGVGFGNWNGTSQQWDLVDWELDLSPPPWTEIDADGSHPNGFNSGSFGEHWAIRRWVADELTATTPIGITWHIDTTGSGGQVTLAIYRNGQKVDSAAMNGFNNTGVTRTNFINAIPGDRIDLALTPVAPSGNREDFGDTGFNWMRITRYLPADPRQPDGSPFIPSAVIDLNGGGPGNDVTVTFAEPTAELIAPAGTISDSGNPILSLTATLTARPDGDAVESLSLNGSATAAAAGLSFSYTSATGILLISGSAPASTYQTILQGILYNNSSDTPNTTPRSVTVVANNTDPSTTQTSTVNVIAVNDPPLAGNDSITRLLGNSTKVAIAELLSNDSDADDAGSTLTLTLPSATSANEAVLSIEGRWVLYSAPASDAVDTFTYSVNDPHGGTATGAVTVTAQPNNEEGKNRLGTPRSGWQRHPH